MNTLLNRLAFVLQGVIILLYLESIVLKLMGYPSEVAAFSKVEMDGMGRYVAIMLEILSIIGILTQRFVIQAAILSILIFATGVFFHLTELEINWWNDGGLRFSLTLLGLVSSISLFVIRNHLHSVLMRKGKLD